MREEIAGLRAARGGQADALALRLYRHLALFVAENFQHMHIEETVHNAILWKHYSDAELLDLHDRLLASIAAGGTSSTPRWMLPAVTPAERAAIVAGMQAKMPPEALIGVLASVRPHIDHMRWVRLAADAGVAHEIGR